MAEFKKSDLEVPGIEKYKGCEKCGAGFENTYIGGQGDWRQTIMCEVCFHVRRAVPLPVIWHLLLEQYPHLGTVEEAQRRDEMAQSAYQATLNKYAVDPTKNVSG